MEIVLLMLKVSVEPPANSSPRPSPRTILSTLRQFCFVSLILLIWLSTISPAFAQLANGGFEKGDLSGWATKGNVEVLQGSNFSPSITPPEGEFFALLSTGPGDSPAPDDGDLDGDGGFDNDITILSQTFTPEPGVLSFKWSWLTDEENTYLEFDDFFLVRLDGNVILSGSVDKMPSLSPFPNILTDNLAYFVTSLGPTGGSYFGDGRSEFKTFTYVIASGTHTIEFIVADAGNHIFDSGLIVDDIVVTQTVGGVLTPAPTPVGGIAVPANKLAILAPYLALVGLIGVVSIVFAIRKHINNN